jgi:hypothetical protein
MRNVLYWLWRPFKVLVPCSLALFLLLVWFKTELHSTPQSPTPGTRLAVHLFVVIVLLIFIFFADAMEVAYSLLRYKDIEQFSGTTARILKEMHKNESLVYEAREWLVTILIVAITLILEFDHVYSPFSGNEIVFPVIPGFPPLSAPKFFSLLFGTLPVLWLVQGPSKRVARECPQKMLDAGVIVWLLVKGVGKGIEFFGLENPTRLASWVLTRDGGFRDESNLKPSDHAYFVSSLQRYGYALHNIALHVTIGPRGGCTIRQRVVYYVIARTHNIFTRKLTLDAPSKGFRLERSEVYRAPTLGDVDPNGNKEIFKQLNGLAADPPQIPPKFEKLLVSPIVIQSTDPGNPRLCKYHVDTRGAIPEDLAAFALLAEFTTDWCDGAFKWTPGESDFFYTKFYSPCYCFQLTLETEAGCSFVLSDVTSEAICGENLHRGEQDRLVRSLVLDAAHPNAVHCELHYPFPGTDYYLRWKNSGEPSFNPCPPLAGAAPVSPTASALQQAQLRGALTAPEAPASQRHEHAQAGEPLPPPKGEPLPPPITSTA